MARESYSFDEANRLSAAGSASYVYDGDGLRTRKTAGSQGAFSWDVSGGSPALLADGQASYVAGPGGLPLEQVSSAGVVQYLHQDERGSTRALSDSLGMSVATYDYDPYGNVTAKTGSATTPLQFAAHYADGESGLAYRGSRYYDPATAQHISRAPSELLSGNPYADPPGGDPAAGGDTPPPATGGDGPTPKPPPRIIPPAAGYPDEGLPDNYSHCDFGLFCAVPDIADAFIGDPLHNPLDAIGLLPFGKVLKAGGLLAKLLKGGDKATKGGLPRIAGGARGAGGRAGKLGPNDDALGPHTVFRRGQDGRIDKYTTFDEFGNDALRFRGSGGSHAGLDPPLFYGPKPGKGPGSPLNRARNPGPDDYQNLPPGY